MGDMNIDLLKCTTHVKSQEYIDNSFSQGFIPLITKPSRVTDYTATLVDHLLYNRHDRRTQSGILVSDISDHYGIFRFIQRSNKVHTSGNTTYISFNEANIINFKNSLKNIDFSNVLETNCADSAYDKFMSLYLGSCNISFPVQTKKNIKKISMDNKMSNPIISK